MRCSSELKLGKFIITPMQLNSNVFQNTVSIKIRIPNQQVATRNQANKKTLNWLACIFQSLPHSLPSLVMPDHRFHRRHLFHHLSPLSLFHSKLKATTNHSHHSRPITDHPGRTSRLAGPLIGCLFQFFSVTCLVSSQQISLMTLINTLINYLTADGEHHITHSLCEPRHLQQAYLLLLLLSLIHI